MKAISINHKVFVYRRALCFLIHLYCKPFTPLQRERVVAFIAQIPVTSLQFICLAFPTIIYRHYSARNRFFAKHHAFQHSVCGARLIIVSSNNQFKSTKSFQIIGYSPSADKKKDGGNTVFAEVVLSWFQFRTADRTFTFRCYFRLLRYLFSANSTFQPFHLLD